ncbi:MAG: sulfite exporter TauE/SafE family protein [Alphaproteobacteria bacterium]|nr:sulfite exporter TauE/SafE family protein [Alphaproteobacteria bacterium]TAD89702.1 MAG: sulfite exporter TauE/SafE family protein [Alphaproteobacteria bacterium]
MQDLLALVAGGLVGLVLGLIGGGGSILAVPLLLYLVGIEDPHRAIGTGALAVAANAAVTLIQHARRGTVKWPCAALFAVFGSVGAAIGSSIGKQVNGQQLLFLFGLIMVAVAAAMVRSRQATGAEEVHLTRRMAPRLAAVSFAVGSVAGFFGIGGGFLIVPGLLAGSGMPLINAIGSSLLSVGLFGLTTAVTYALSGLVAWPIALEFILGGLVGGWLGTRLGGRLAQQRTTLTRVFAGVVGAVAVYILWRSAPATWALLMG